MTATLFLEASSDVFHAWRGERLPTGVLINSVDAHRLSDAELLEIGPLYRPAPAEAVPFGKVVSEVSVQRVGGVVKFVNALADVPPPSRDDVVVERERRLSLGFQYDFGDGRGVHHIGTRPEDMRKWMDEVTPLSQAYLNLGQPSGEITITTETGPVTVTAVEWQQILLGAAQWRQPIYQASFLLQAMDPIPADFADEEWWT